MIRIYLLLLCLFFSLTYADNYALLISNSHYQDRRISNLRNPVRDANDLRDALEQVDFEVTLDSNLTQIEMKEAVQNFARKLKPNDIAIFFFAGHGFQIEGINYLAAYDTDFDNLTGSSAVAGELLNILQDENSISASTGIIVILDACRNHPEAVRNQTLQEGLAAMNIARPKTLLIYSTTADKRAYDGWGEANSPYMAELKKFIANPDLSVMDIFTEAHQRVRSRTSNEAQYPEGPQDPYMVSQWNEETYFTYAAPREIYVNSQPEGANILVDGAPKGVTPATIEVSRGDRSLHLELPGYATYRGELQKDEQLSRDFTVEKRTPTINLYVNELPELLRRLELGGDIHLAAVNFDLNETLELRGNIRLIGQRDMQQDNNGRNDRYTTFISNKGVPLILYKGGGTLEIENFRLENVSGLAGELMIVEDGYVRIASSQFTGAPFVYEDNGSLCFEALIFANHSKGDITDSNFTRNCIGAHVKDEAVVDFHNNDFRNNDWFGLAFTGNGQGEVVNSDIAYNNDRGIYITGNASPTLEGNNIFNNRGAGISYAATSSGAALRNYIYENGGNGINLQDDANPELTDNQLYQNSKAGIAYFDNTAGIALRNESYDNKFHGIIVDDDASPILERNSLHNNTEAGLAYMTRATGIARYNNIYENIFYGIYIDSMTAPELSNNTISNNYQADILDKRNEGNREEE